MEELEEYFESKRELNVWLNGFDKHLWARPIDAIKEGRINEVIEVARNGKEQATQNNSEDQGHLEQRPQTSPIHSTES